MVKKHVLSLIDIRLIVFLIVIVALCAILTLLISDKVEDFAKKYKKKFYGYILLFVLIYTLIAFLGYNKLFIELRNEFIFYQAASLLLGSLHAWFYREFFQEFNLKKYSVELLFSFIVPLYSSILFVIIYTFLNGINFTLLMSAHFLVFVIPTCIYMVFCFMMLIPPRKYITWTPEKSYSAIKDDEMEAIVLITFLIKKSYDDTEYTSIRVQAPVKVSFGRLFFLAVAGYNKQNEGEHIDLQMPDGKDYNWVFYLQSKWYENTRYIDAAYDGAMNQITENSVVICQREIEKNAPPEKKKKTDQKLYGVDSHNEAADQEKFDELKETEKEEAIK